MTPETRLGSWTKLETDIGSRQWTKPRDSGRKTVKIESFLAIYHYFLKNELISFDFGITRSGCKAFLAC